MRLRHAVLLAGLAGVVGPLVEPLFPILRRTVVPVLPLRADPIRVLHVSDLHLLPRHGRRSAWIRGLAGLGADLVVSTGDHLSSAEAIPLLGASLGALTSDGTPGVFVPGNNDYYSPRRPNLLGYLTQGSSVRRGPDLPWQQAARTLETVGWTDLTHRRIALPLGGLIVTLTGTDDAHLQRDRYDRVAGPAEGDLAIGVTHTPQLRVLDAFAGDGHGLLLAGHTHGGQLRLPGLGPVVTNCDLDRGRARGLSRHGTSWLHVSAGLGTSPYAPVRAFCRPEATLLTLVPVR
ncbi:MAG: metallophosphoesterase [Frankiales bacterium]|jgi:predicted MPP superfamily phosphohydrolase|nr:metallophosphoesterase [Frankiales bacterium]